MAILDPTEVGQLKLFAWVLFIIDLCIVGVSVLFGRAVDDAQSGAILVAAAAILVNGALAMIVGGNLAVVLLLHWWRGHGRRRARRLADRAGSGTPCKG